MSLKRIPRKPDQYNRGGVYLCELPKQLVTEKTDGTVRQRDGVERHGSPPCVVISSNDFNENQTSGLIVLPLISGLKVELTKFKNVPPTWVRVIFQGEAAFGLVEQIRYIDRSRCGVQIGQLVEYDLKQVEDKLRELLLRNVWCRE